MVMRAKVGKSRARYAASMAARRGSTTVATRCGSRVDVSADAFMPSVLPVSFFLSLTTAMRMARSGHAASSATCTAMQSEPSGLRAPRSHRTNPPYMLRHADPLPCRAMVDSSPG